MKKVPCKALGRQSSFLADKLRNGLSNPFFEDLVKMALVLGLLLLVLTGTAHLHKHLPSLCGAPAPGLLVSL